MAHDVRHEDGAFFIEEGGKRIAEMTYAREGKGAAVIDHTFVDPKLRGQGVARKLVEAAVGWARKDGVKLNPVCPYAKKALDEAPEWQDVMGS